MVVLADDPAWGKAVAHLRSQGVQAALILATGAAAALAAAEMATELGRGELGRGEPWRVEDRRGQPGPTPGM